MKGNKVTITEAANLLGITRQGIFHAIKKCRIYAERDAMGKYLIDVTALDEYERTRWDRRETTRQNGHKIFNVTSGYISTLDAMEILGLKRFQIYYLRRQGALLGVRVGNLIAWRKDDIVAFKSRLGDYNFLTG